jgi:hypothetical protein
MFELAGNPVMCTVCKYRSRGRRRGEMKEETWCTNEDSNTKYTFHLVQINRTYSLFDKFMFKVEFVCSP